MISRRNSAFCLAGIALAAMVFVAPVQAENAPKVKLATSLGDIVVELNPAKAPKTVENFLQYVAEKHYDGTVFHRVIDGFMIQGGGFTADMTEKSTRAPIRNEATNGLSNKRGTIAMARTADPNSASAQFFINVGDNVGLDQAQAARGSFGYAVFGHVTSGMEVVDAIVAVPTGVKKGYENVPLQPVVIKKATVTTGH